MTIYYITVSLVFVFLCIAQSNMVKSTDLNNKTVINKTATTNVFLGLATAVLIFVSGFRYYVGADFGAYYKFAYNYAPNWLSALKELDEPGFPVLGAIIKLFTTDGAAFIFITAAFTMTSILAITFKYIDTYLFSALLFIFTGIWHGSFNGVRQFFAAAIICLGHRLILDKKLFKYLLCVFIAFLFHKSAIIMAVPYFMLRGKVNLRNILLLTIGSIVLLYNYEFIFSLFGGLKESEFIIEEGSYYLNQVNILRVLVCIVPAVFCLFIYMKSEKTKEKTFYLNCLILYALLSVIGMNSPYISRINIYLLVLVPLAMGKLVEFKDKNTEIIVKIGIIVLFFFFWRYDLLKSSAVYRFIWQR